MSIITPEMGLTLSTIGTDSGLTWEQNLNASLLTIDNHNHTPGNGNQITPSGLNINATLTFNGQLATGLQAAQFTPQTSLGTLGAIYVSGADLFFNDTAGNVVQITSGGTVNATSSGISSGTATASFVSGVLVVNSASNTPANIQAGSLLLGNNVASSKYLTLQPPSAMAANTTVTLPTIPSSTNFMQLDSSGNMSASIPVSAGLTTSNLSASANIIGSQLSASASIVGSQLSSSAAIVGTQLSSSAGITPSQNDSSLYSNQGSPISFSTSSTSSTLVMSLTSGAAFSTTRPVFLSFIGEPGGTNSGVISITSVSGGGAAYTASIAIVRKGVSSTSTVATYLFSNTVGVSGGYTPSLAIPCSILNTIDLSPDPTKQTYEVFVSVNATSTSFSCNEVVMQLVQV